MSLRKFHRNIDSDICRYGRSVICVGRCDTCDDGSPFVNFCYTIGNWPRFPELLIIGTLDGSILNTLSNMMIGRGAAFADGELVDPGGMFPIRIIDADHRAREEYTVQAGQHFGHEEYHVLQVLIPDDNGRFPDCPECQPPYSAIPVLRAWMQ